MSDSWLNMWNERYAEPDYAYGIEPNVFFKEQLDKLAPAKLLMGAEGEGRNAVYAANQGWEVTAFDISVEARKKALKLAADKGVSLDYKVGFLPELDIPDNSFDALGLIFAHFPSDIRPEFHNILSRKLKTGGIVIVEAFNKDHLQYRQKNPKVGGPRDLQTLMSKEELTEAFADFDILELEETEAEFNEGLYHIGTGSVVRFVARRK
ncbi:class I SAM-dependent methyltransferase [Gaetbulibacter aestuarii]|uniref:Class I SAM-dependent methyltransferase n=1 Tax=Gaetbulibacter aestuarii TaxID=1502358 RepID=A0ABW7MX70_9FLAO